MYGAAMAAAAHESFVTQTHQQNEEEDEDDDIVCLDELGDPYRADRLLSSVSADQVIPGLGLSNSGPFSGAFPGTTSSSKLQKAEKHGGRDDWSDIATLALLEAWGEKCMRLNRWHLKLEDWAELAETVRSRSKCLKTDVQCKNRVDTLKKKFKHEKQKQAEGIMSKWPFYRVLDSLLSASSRRAPGLPTTADAGQIVEISPAGLQYCLREEDSDGDEDEVGPSRCKRSLDMAFHAAGDHYGSEAEGIKYSKKRRHENNSYSGLADAVLKFGQVFEKLESFKRQQLMDLEKLRMQYIKDLELQRMQLFMQTQMELAKMKVGHMDRDDSRKRKSP